MNKKNEIVKNLPLIIFFIFFIFPLIKSIIPIIIIGLVIGGIFYLKNNKFNLNKFNKSNVNNAIDLDKLKYMDNTKKTVIMIAGSLLLAWLFFASIIIVDAGQTGVYSLFGKVKDDELSSGFHLVIPLAKVTKISIREESYTMTQATGEGHVSTDDAIPTLTKEGAKIDLDITVRYKIEEEKASDIYSNIGTIKDVDEKIIRPTIRTSIRDVVARYEAKDIYSDKRQEVSDGINDELVNKLSKTGIIVVEVLLRNVVLSSMLANTIEEKLQAEQEAEKYTFILEKEKKEKERKIIEAEGQRDAQKIINESLSTNYLYYQYINSLKDREGTVYVPTGSTTGMPLFKELGR